ncbi:MAG TPA: hypothetical protein VGS23_08265, partial [Thermoplasmata archaeon]|nr:hypothetical protein [Thermoplasmata archaeon]
MGQIPEDELLTVFLEAANSEAAIEEASHLPGAARKWQEKTRFDYQLGRRTAAAWRTVWERWPEGHERYSRDWAADNEARRSAGLNGKGEVNPWAGREGWETEPEIPIRHKDSKSTGGRYEKRPVEPGYVTYNELVTRERFRPFRTAAGQARVAVPSTHGLEIYDPSDAEFVRRIGYSLFSVRGEPIPQRELGVAASTLTSRALSRALPTERIVELWLRVAPSGKDSSRIDMRDTQQRCIAVGPDGWTIEPTGYPTFDPRAHMLPLPDPAPSGVDGGWKRVEGLWRFIRLPPADGRSDQQLLALASLVLFVLSPGSPKPVSVWNGEERIGKSTMAGCLQAMVDPSRVKVIKSLEQDDDLVNIAINHAVINLDNLSYIRGDFSDAIAGLCTGTGLVKRELYSDTGEVAFSVRR